ncbi:MAG: exodeoxyribonuclease VII large subunit [Planctomycetota bacterium]
MSGTVELDPDRSHLVVRFQYREDLVAEVKEVPGRRWDPRNKTWRVPVAQTERVYATFSRHLFEFAPEVMSLLAGTLGAPAPAAPKAPKPRPGTLPLDGDAPPAEAAALRISELNARVRDALRAQFDDAFWIQGEIVDYDKSAGRQHRFFQLVEKAHGESRALAAVEAALFAGTAERLLPRLAGGDAPLTLRDGIEIRALVKVDLYPASGRFQVVIQDVDPSFTLGKLALTKEQILRELLAAGLATRNRSLPLPVPALRIGVLASPDSDGWNDFVRHLEESPVGFDVSLFPIKVQGKELRPSLLAGLAWFAAHAGEIDVLCILRGGGSRTDLAWFDDKDIAFAVAQHPLKVLVGIGHQRDQSVLDAIAHSEKTPTAVASLLVECAAAARQDVRERAMRLQDAVNDHLDRLLRFVGGARTALQRATLRRLERERTTLAQLGRTLQSATLLRLAGVRSRLQAAAARAGSAATRGLERAALRLEAQAVRQRLLDPRHVLARGFALARDARGRIVTSVARLGRGDALTVQFRDGKANAHVDDVTKEIPSP